MPEIREILYGRQPVYEALRGGRREVFKVLVADAVRADAQAMTRLSELAAAKGIAVRPAPLQEIERLARGGHHQGVAAEVGPYVYAERDDLLAVAAQAGEPPFLLLLDHIQDPQNLGAMLRTADAVGVHGVLIPKDRSAEVTPAVVRASAGASEHVRVARVVNLHQAMLALRKAEVWLAGLDLGPGARPYTAADLRGPLGLVVGAEGEGLSRLVRETCDFLIALPMKGQVGSLNASAACAVALYEARRQRG